MYEQDQSQMIASQSSIPTMMPEKYTPDVEKESVGLRQTGPQNCNPKYFSGRQSKATTGGNCRYTTSIVGLNIQRIRMSGIADLKECNGQDKDEDRARI